jgi:hypothetical protein
MYIVELYTVNIYRQRSSFIVRVMVAESNRYSCKEYIERVKIQPLQSQYLLIFKYFVAENIGYFGLNSEIHGF